MNRCETSSFNTCDSKFKLVDANSVPRDLEDMTEIPSSAEISGDSYVYVYDESSKNDKYKKIKLANLLNPDKISADWTETDPNKPSYIQNKPDLSTLALKEDLMSLFTVGGISAGEVLPKGSTALDILSKLLFVKGDVGIWFGVSNQLPTELSGDPDKVASISDLLINGADTHAVLNNQYFTICVSRPKGIKQIEIKEILQGGWPLSFYSVPFNKGMCDIYYLEYKGQPMLASGDYDIHVTFKHVGE